MHISQTILNQFFKKAVITSLFLSAFFITTPVFGQAIQDQAVTPNTSRNWSGYVSSGGIYTAVIGSWIVPTIQATTTLTAHTTWVGIGGFATDDLIQAGTQAITNPTGAVVYQAWYELLPAASITVPLDVKAGDSITTAINRINGNTWNIIIVNNTTKKYYEKTVEYHSSLSSVEWIQEMVTGVISSESKTAQGYIPLDSFGSIKFTNGATMKDGKFQSIKTSGAKQITMINNKDYALATVSPLNAQGSGFVVTRTSAEPTSPLTIDSSFTGNLLLPSATSPHTIERYPVTRSFILNEQSKPSRLFQNR